MVGRMGSGASTRQRGHVRGPSTTSNFSGTGRRRAASTEIVRSTVGMGQSTGIGKQDQQQLLPQPERRDERRDSNWPLPKNGFV